MTRPAAPVRSAPQAARAVGRESRSGPERDRDASQDSTQGAPRVPCLLYLALFALVGIPLVVELVLLIGKTWLPVSDHAIEVLRIEDVGGSHTPLVGAYSRYGWYHPGPILFWLLAAPYRVLGENGLLAGALLLNLAAAVGAVAVAIRRGGLPLAIATTAGVALLCHAMGPELLMDPWNPWACVLAFFVYILLGWSIAERDWPMLPWAVGIGSFVVQCHFGYTPLVLGLGAVAAVLACIGRAARPPDGADLRRNAVYAGVVACLLWLPPLIQQFTGSPGNLGDLFGAARDPKGHTAGWANGFGLMGTELDVPGPLFRGDDRGFVGFVPAGGTNRALALVAATALLGWWAHRRGERSAARLAVISVAGAGLGVITASRITGAVVPYLLRWSWVLALVLYLSCAWSLWTIVRHAEVAATCLVAILGVFAVVVAVLNVGAAVATDAPTPAESKIVAQLATQMARHLDRDDRYLVRWEERDYLRGIGPGMVLELANEGFEVRVPEQFSHIFSHRGIGSRSTTDATVRIVGTSGDTPAAPYEGEELIASLDALTPADGSRLRDLRAVVESQLREACGARVSLLSRCVRTVLEDSSELRRAVDEVAELGQQGDSYRVFLARR